MRIRNLAGAALTAIAGLALAAPAAVLAQDFPTRAIEIVNPYPAGGTTDGLTRALAPGLSERLGESVVVVNQGGAAGAIGTAAVARAEPDGHTLIFMPALTLSVLPFTQGTDYSSDSFVGICQTFSNAMALVTLPDSPFDSIADVVAAAKENPGSIEYGHQGVASIPHLAMVEFTETADVDILDVAYAGEPQVLLDLEGGRIDLASVVLGGVAGRDLKILGIFGEERHPALPDVPTVTEQGYDVAPTSFGGLFAPAGTPEPVIEKLSEACEGAAHDDLYVQAAENAFQPTNYFDPAEEFHERLMQDIEDKARLLDQLDVGN